MGASVLDPQQRHAIDEVFTFANAQFDRGVSAVGVENLLKGKGLEPRSAALVVRQLAATRARAAKASAAASRASSAGRSGLFGYRSLSNRSAIINIGLGLLLTFLGTVLTIASYSSVDQHKGGNYTIFTGLIGCGVIDFLYGVFQIFRS